MESIGVSGMLSLDRSKPDGYGSNLPPIGGQPAADEIDARRKIASHGKTPEDDPSLRSRRTKVG